jgi:hypothetical protein
MSIFQAILRVKFMKNVEKLNTKAVSFPPRTRPSYLLHIKQPGLLLHCTENKNKYSAGTDSLSEWECRPSIVCYKKLILAKNQILVTAFTF